MKAVHCPTQDEFNKLMKAYEKVGWRFGNGETASEFSTDYSGQIDITFEDFFAYGYELKAGYTIISVDQAIEELIDMFPEKFGLKPFASNTFGCARELGLKQENNIKKGSKKYADYSKILDECKELSADRGASYGTVKENLTNTADIAKTAFGVDITPRDIALVMVANKMARNLCSHKRDNALDGINYWAIAEHLKETVTDCDQLEHAGKQEEKERFPFDGKHSVDGTKCVCGGELNIKTGDPVIIECMSCHAVGIDIHRIPAENKQRKDAEKLLDNQE